MKAGFPIVVGVAVALIPATAHAGEVGLIVGLADLVFGAAALLAAVGLLGLGVALERKSRAATRRIPFVAQSVSNRLWLSLAAGVALFLVGAIAAFFLRKEVASGLALVAGAAVVYAIVQLVIAARLYGRIHDVRPERRLQALRRVCYGVAGLVAVVPLLAYGATRLRVVREALRNRPTSEVREYLRGCERGKGQDCHMVGLRYETGDPPMPADPAKSAAAYGRGCELGFRPSCEAAMFIYAEGDGVEKNPELAKKYRDLYEGNVR